MANKKIGLVTLEYICETGEWTYKGRADRSNEIFFIVSGEATVIEDFSRFPLTANDVFCCRKGSVYQVYNDGEGELQMYRLSFTGDYGTIPKNFTVNDSATLLQLLPLGMKLLSIEGYPKSAFDPLCELILAELTYESLDETVKKDTAASALLGWIEENKHLNIKVMDAAAHFGLSEGYLTRSFREEYSLNLKSYIDTVRQKYVCEQLEDTSLSLTEVALKCGFENHRQLNTFMNYHLGMSPSEYRKSRRKWVK